jgi:dihydroorotase
MATITLPGLIDVHVHLRDPGATHKEDFETGTRAALKGGFTRVIDMPNNSEPTTSIRALKKKKRLVAGKALIPVGFHFGTNGKNTSSFLAAAADEQVFGLKLYCNHTTGEMLIEDLGLLEKVFEAWETDKPILVHAEGVQLAAVISLAQLYGRRLHVCHITQAIEVELVARAKGKGIGVTAGVCPHHLFMSGEWREKLGPYALMKPPLGTKKDMQALRKGLTSGVIDIVETDHAPHTKKEKASKVPPYGVPGLDTALPLMYRAVDEGWFEEKGIRTVLHDRPRELFRIPKQIKTRVVLETGSFKIGDDGYETKCGWSPFDGWDVPVRVKSVMLEGKTLLTEGKIVGRK